MAYQNFWLGCVINIAKIPPDIINEKGVKSSHFWELTKRAFSFTMKVTNQCISGTFPNSKVGSFIRSKFDGKIWFFDLIFKIYSLTQTMSIRFQWSSLVSNTLFVLWWMMILSPSKFRLREFVYFSAGIAIAGRWHRWLDEISHRFTNFAKT